MTIWPQRSFLTHVFCCILEFHVNNQSYKIVFISMEYPFLQSCNDCMHGYFVFLSQISYKNPYTNYFILLDSKFVLFFIFQISEYYKKQPFQNCLKEIFKTMSSLALHLILALTILLTITWISTYYTCCQSSP